MVILDASWGKFANYISYKAVNAGKYTVQVIGNPQQVFVNEPRISRL